MSTTKPSIDLPRSLPYEDAPNYYSLTDLTNLIIADTVWAHRKQARMSETKLADAMNKSRNFVRIVESGRYSVTLAEFKSLAGALNLDHLDFANEVLEEVVMASNAVTTIAEPGISLIEPRVLADTQGDVEKDAQEDSKECVQDGAEENAEECAQEDVKKDERGMYRKTLRNRRKMPPKTKAKGVKDDQRNAQENAAGADPEGPAPDD